MRLSSLSKIKNNNFSLYHYHEQEMIENILSMFGNTKYSIVIYPHPHEINIFKKIDKKPQYFSYLQTYKNLSISTEKKD
jgi:hypothetical protein